MNQKWFTRDAVASGKTPKLVGWGCKQLVALMRPRSSWWLVKLTDKADGSHHAQLNESDKKPRSIWVAGQRRRISCRQLEAASVGEPRFWASNCLQLDRITWFSDSLNIIKLIDTIEISNQIITLALIV